ncbi:MAG: hypothetical protein QOJ86_5032 [Bradyrhizobium sp.]|jgi:hypothetical protein|nr:hypothetical protein [Bradyrhizobium sp.]
MTTHAEKRDIISFELSKQDFDVMSKIIPRMEVTAGVNVAQPGAFTIRNHSFSPEKPGAFVIRNHNFSLDKPGAYAIRNYRFEAK